MKLLRNTFAALAIATAPACNNEPLVCNSDPFPGAVELEDPDFSEIEDFCALTRNKYEVVTCYRNEGGDFYNTSYTVSENCDTLYEMELFLADGPDRKAGEIYERNCWLGGAYVVCEPADKEWEY